MTSSDIRIQKAFDWLKKENGENFLLSEEYCPTRDVFGARLGRMAQEMEKREFLKETYALLAAIAGEIGNNAFDHNLGSWHDVPGIYFVYDLENRFMVIADRGQGLLATLKRVAPELQTENQAIKMAFTKVISGRSPERRGNGLKFVESVVHQYHLKINFYSNDGMYIINQGLHEGDVEQHLKGVLAVINF